VIVQVAISTLVLIGMGLCQRSLYNLRHVDPGFSERKLLATEMALSRNGYSEARGKQVYETLRQRARAVAGVESVSLTTFLPLLGAGPEALYLPDGQKITVVQGVVDADYFATFGIRVLAGRVFTSIDREGSQEAVVINRKLADLLWPGKDPTGRNVMVGTPARKAMVVGMVADGKYEDLDEPQRPFVYFALSQHYRDALYLVARTAGDPGAWIEPLAQVQRGLGLPVPMPPFTLDNWMNLTILVQRITATCVAALSGLGLLLAIIGLFGAISYSVSERKKELGIRVALGAQSWQLLGMVLRQTLSVAGAGVALGVMLGVGATVLLRSQFYAVSAVEWTVLVPVGVGMVGVSAIVAYLSARPWISVDPMEAVRHV
jgi:predicted permease